jgi:hypothetical protein
VLTVLTFTGCQILAAVSAYNSSISPTIFLTLLVILRPLSGHR